MLERTGHDRGRAEPRRTEILRRCPAAPLPRRSGAGSWKEPTLRVVAAAFAEFRQARAVLAELRARFGVGASDAEVAPLGTSEAEAQRSLLAGRFPPEILADVRLAVERGGGTVVVDVDESMTRPVTVSRGESRDPRVVSRAPLTRPGTKGLALF